MEHLRLEIFDLPTADNQTPMGSQNATLEENASITIVNTSEIFASGDVWSYSFRLNVWANLHIFGTAGDIHGSRLHDQIHKRRARLWIDGIAAYLGYLKLADEAEIDADGNIDVTFESGQKTFDDMIEGAKANQVPMINDVQIGMALWHKRKTFCKVKINASASLIMKDPDDPLNKKNTTEVSEVEFFDGTWGDTGSFSADGENDSEAVQAYPRMIFPKGRFEMITEGSVTSTTGNRMGGQHQAGEDNTVIEEVDCINTDSPFDDEHPYCNVALCYQRYGYERRKKDGTELPPDYSAEPEAQRGYETMPADRVNSAPNFFVLYWLKALMKHLGIYIEENQMMDVEDLRRLFFVNTRCAIKEPKYMRKNDAEHPYGMYQFLYEGRNISRLVPEYFGKQIKEDLHGTPIYYYDRNNSCIDIKEDASSFKCTNIQGADNPDYDHSKIDADKIPTIDKVKLEIKEVVRWDDQGTPMSREGYERENGYLYRAYADKTCFPDVDISEVIQALENGFGARLLFSDDYKRVRIVLLRNVFNDNEIQDISCDIVGGEEKTENSIRGFRMTYGNTEDTQFYYKGFADKLPHKKPYFIDDSDKHDYSYWNLDANYSKLIRSISAFDKTCYVTKNTGNAYGIKVDKDAKTYNEQFPSLFEYAGYMDAEDGDCSGNEETIHEVSLNFTPAIMNDVNVDNERSEKAEQKQQFALFVDATMRPRRIDLEDGVDYNDPTQIYYIYDAPKKPEDRKALYGEDSKGLEMMGDSDVIRPGDFAIRSDMYFTDTGLRTQLVYNYIKRVIISDKPTQIKIPIRWNLNMDIEGTINEGYRLYLQDNFEPNDEGISPIETHDWGLTLGIMRGSGADAYVEYSADAEDQEENDTWKKIPGSSITAHPDTCDSYGNEWDYNGSMHVTPAEAPAKIAELFPDSDAPFNNSTLGYITETTWMYSKDTADVRHVVLIATAYSIAGTTVTYSGDIRSWSSMPLEELVAISEGGRHMIIEVDSSQERGDTLIQLCALAYGGATEPMVIDDGVGSRYGRFSLKLRAEKPNPYFDPTLPESSENPRYLAIGNENLRQRGLCDQFYKEYSYWIRNARICKRTVRMTLADLLKIDKTKKLRIGDVTGFVRKMEFSVSNKDGLGNAELEIMYI